jgi:hypothetical protein
MSVTISGSGQIVKQVISVTKTDTFSTTSTSFTDVTGLSATITPTNSANKILVFVSMTDGISSDYVLFTRITRNGTAVGIGDAAGSRTRASTGGYNGTSGTIYQNIPQNIVYLDSPATTSATTYTVQLAGENSGGTYYVNRTGNDSDSAFRGRYASSITVMEIAYA